MPLLSHCGWGAGAVAGGVAVVAGGVSADGCAAAGGEPSAGAAEGASEGGGGSLAKAETGSSTAPTLFVVSSITPMRKNDAPRTGTLMS